MKLYKTTDYVAGAEASVDSIEMDLSTSECTQGSQQPSVLK